VGSSKFPKKKKFRVTKKEKRNHKLNEMETRRILKEYRNLCKEGAQDDTILLTPLNDEDLFHWKAFIKGPIGTPFENGVFRLEITVPTQYPLEPPQVRFVTKVFHPNVHFKVKKSRFQLEFVGDETRISLSCFHQSGEICLDLLKIAWSAIFTLQSVCRAIITLLATPEPDSPLNCDCGELLFNSFP
jgi:peroxin-4